MATWIFQNGGMVVAIIEILGFVVFGALAFMGVFTGNARQINSENDRVAQDLIQNYRTMIDEQNKKIQLLSDKEIEQGKTIAHLEGQLKILSDMVALRDPKTAEVFRDAPMIFAIAKENNLYTKANNEAIKNLTTAIESFINRIPPVMAIMKP